LRKVPRVKLFPKKNDPLLVKWERIGDRPAAPSQLLPIVGPTSENSDEDVFFPKRRRDAEVQTTDQKMMIAEEVEEERVLSLGRMEENAAIEAMEAAAKAAAKLAAAEQNEGNKDEESKGNTDEESKGKGKGKGQRMGKGKMGKADVTV
jgi:hypothetical protein